MRRLWLIQTNKLGAILAFSNWSTCCYSNEIVTCRLMELKYDKNNKEGKKVMVMKTRCKASLAKRNNLKTII